MTENQKNLSAEYWNSRYAADNTPWDIGEASQPLVSYFEKLEDKTTEILIPGAGKAHEAVWLFRNGFENVFVCDWAESSFEHLKNLAPEFPEEQLLVSDYFKIERQFDLIVEQTFFCAIDKNLRKKYAEKSAAILKPGGKLAGVMFGIEFDRPGPPFGGSKEEYIGIFAPHFNILHLETSANSIMPRLGNELFIELEKK